jgi:MFS family permease
MSLVFLVQAVAAGAFLTRIPDIQQTLGVDEGVLGLALLGQTAGGLLLIPVASLIVQRSGTRTTMLLGLPLLALMVALVSVAFAPQLVFVCLAIYGATFAVTNVAMNVEVDRIEAATGKRVMNWCHGMASIGLLATSLLGAAARGAGIPHTVHLFAVLPVVLVATALLIVPLKPAAPRAHEGRKRPPLLVRPTIATLYLVGVAISAFVLEGTARTWSIIYMRDSFVVPEWLQALSLTAFLLAMVLGRLAGDRLATRFGPVATGRSALLVALGGLVVIFWAPTPSLALAGFVLLGLGTSVVYPLVLSAAARLGDRPSSENVASVTMIGAVAVLGAPALLGYVAETWGIRIVFLALAPVVLVSLLVSRSLDRRENR